ncbi:MAG: adenylate kinase [Candidatus Omnitrophota bacterium]
MNLVLLGPPGAGKGTQAALLTKAYKLLHISTGDMLREAIKEGSKVGLEAKTYMDSGELVPDETVTQLVVERMDKPDAESGVILDGFPRTRKQAESLDKALSSESRSLDKVLYLRTTGDVAVQRLSGRRVCPTCGKNYHITNMPPAKDNVCDKCGVELILRDDDKPETVKNRLVVYEQQTKDLIEYYTEKSVLEEVDGDLPAEELFKKIDILFREEGLIDDSSDKQG